MDPKKMAIGLMVKKGKMPEPEPEDDDMPDGAEDAGDEPEDDGDDQLTACCHDIIQAVHDGDADALKMALKDAFVELESEPHSEGPSAEEE
jgi:hypothetical protein